MPHPFSKRVQKIEISAIKQMAMKAQKYDNVISFGWGIPFAPSHDVIREGIKKSFIEDPHFDKYAPVPGILPLRERIVAEWQEEFGRQLPLENVLVTAGAMEALMCTMHTLFDEGDELMVMDPGFSSHIEQMHLTGVTPKFVSLKESEGGWHLTREALESQVSDKTKAMILINPHNPTGQVFSKEDIDLIAEVMIKHDMWLIVDEPYSYLKFSDCDTLYHPLEIPEMRERTIVIRSYSKKYSMTGWRVGYVAAPRPDIILQLMKVHDATIVSAPRVSQVAAYYAHEVPEDYIQMESSEMEKRRDSICAWFDKMPDLFSYVKPGGSYYIFPKIVTDKYDDVTLANTLLEEVHVVTTPG